MSKFEPKGEDVLRQEVTENYGLNEEDNKELVDKIVADRLKDEEFKSSLHRQKVKRGKKIKELEGKTEDKKEVKDLNDSKEDKKDEPKFATLEDLENAQKRQKYSWMEDTEFNAVNDEAKKTGKTIKEVMETNPIFKTHFETKEIKARQESATGKPSTMSKTGEVSDKRFDRNFPPGF